MIIGTKFTLVLYFDDGKVKTYRSGKARRILSKSHEGNWTSATLVAVYTGEGGKRIGSNRYICANPFEVWQAIHSVVEPELLSFVRDNNE